MITAAGQAPLLHPAQARREAARIRVIRLALAVYAMAIFEGALRKWAFPQYQQVIYFLRDPIALASIATALYAGLVTWSAFLAILCAAGLALSVLATLQIIGQGYPPLAAAFGLRTYLLYPLLAGVLAQVMRREDLLGLARTTLYLCVPMAVLAVIQHLSPESAAINRSYSDGAVFTVVGGVVRTTGTFTFTTGMACFIAAALCFLAVACHQAAAARGMGTLALALVGGATASLLAVSGSRTAFVHAAITSATLLLVEAARGPGRRRPLMVVGLLSGLALFAGFMQLAFPHAISFIAERQANATASGENFIERLGSVLFDDYGVVDRATALGVGIGGLSVGGAMLAGSAAFGGNGGWAEYEFSRVVLECGLLGVCYMALRYLLAIWLLLAALRCVRRHDDTVPLLLWAVTGVLITTGQLTSQGTVNAYGWLFTGWTLAALATSAPRAQKSGVPDRVPAADRHLQTAHASRT